MYFNVRYICTIKTNYRNILVSPEGYSNYTVKLIMCDWMTCVVTVTSLLSRENSRMQYTYEGIGNAVLSIRVFCRIYYKCL